MKRMLFSLILVCIGGGSAISQSTTGDETSRFKPDTKKPSVYVSFSKWHEEKESCSLEQLSMYELKLTNNSPFLINVDATFAASAKFDNFAVGKDKFQVATPDMKVELCYDVDSVLTVTTEINGPDIMTTRSETGSKTTSSETHIVLDVPKLAKVPELSVYCTCKWRQQTVRRYDSPGLWIKPGSSVLFNVPTRYVTPGLTIFTLYNYIWEFDGGRLREKEPHHQVFFGA